MFFEQHLLDLDIVAFFDQRDEGISERVGTHIHNCNVCAARLKQVAPNDFKLQQSEDDAEVVRALAGISPGGENLRALVSLFNRERVVDPQPGQVWRLHWEDVTHLAMIASTAYGNLTVWPITLEVQLADESALLVPASDSGEMGLELAIWPAIETGIGTYVLERYVTEILPPERLRSLRRAYRIGGDLPVQWRPGAAAAGPESPRGKFRTDLVQVAGFLGEASWEPEEWAQCDTSDLPSLAEALSAAGISATQLAEKLGISARRAISLRRGVVEPSLQELSQLHDVFDLSASGLSAAPQREVIEALDNPRARDLILRAAEVEGKSEVLLRRDLATGHFSLAARKTKKSEDAAFEMLVMELKKRLATSQESEI
ncbi:helix-turn-helix transcriptional regulator [Streptomyces sp. NPDC048324]|uniref:helix-turn-helix domain-containing protein n=1 Tax=Streptomyces sp. NPDC048324 TaxID=3157205 RepID=UPI0034125A4C